MINKIQLNSNIRVVTEYIPHVKSVAVGLFFKVGSVRENEINSGISHFVEHMMFKGTANRTAKQIAEDIDKTGGQINAFTSKEMTCYYIKTLSESIEPSMDVLFDMMMNSKYDEEELDRERQVIFEEMKMIEDDPDDLAHELIVEAIFKDSALGKSIIGTPDSLANIDRKRMIDYIANEYVRENIVISIAGNFDEERILAYIDGKLDALKESKSDLEETYVEYTPVYKTVVKDISQSHICICTKGVSTLSDEYYNTKILASIMGGSMSSRLFQTIREQRGLAYSIYSSASSYTTDGYINIYAGVAHEKLEETIDAIKDQLELLQKDGIQEEELFMVKQHIKSGYIFGLENVSSRMFAIGKSMLLENTIYLPDEEIAKIEKVTLQDVMAVRNKMTEMSNYSIVAISGEEFDVKRAWQK